MDHADAVFLIAPGVARRGGRWADLGAGSGTFTRALATLLGPTGIVHAVDRSSDVLALSSAASDSSGSAQVVPLQADFREPLALPALDGVMMANSLHFLAPRAQLDAVNRLTGLLVDGGAFLLVEYDQSRGSPWVPHPLTPRRFAQLAEVAGLSEPTEIGRRRSRYGPRDMYAAVARKAALG